MTAVEVRGLDASYDTTPVLHGVALTVEAGTVAAVLGPSGSGKSTLLRVLAGLHRPRAGSVAIDGRVVDDAAGTFVPPEQRGIGLVPQTGALFPHLSVAGNIAFGLRTAGRSERRDRVDELLELTDLDGLARRMPHQLSGGQRQRVALARALAPDPHLVLLDEPFTALDAGLRVSLRAEVLRILHAAGATALLVTHDQAEAMSMAGSIALIRDGRIEQSGTPSEVYATPATPWVGTFLGESTLVPGVSDGTVAQCPLGSLAHDEMPAGDVRLLVRPEQVEVATAGVRPADGAHGASERRTQAVTATVVTVDFQGHDALVVARVGQGDDAVFVRARVAATELPVVGDDVAVTVRGAVRAFPADAAG